MMMCIIFKNTNINLNFVIWYELVQLLTFDIYIYVHIYIYREREGI